MNRTIEEKSRFGQFDLSAYRGALQLAKVGMWELDLETGLLHLSDEHIDMLGDINLTNTIPMSEYIERFVYEEDREDLAEVAPKIVLGQWDLQQTELEYRILHAEGYLINVFVKMNFNPLDQKRLWGISQNITTIRMAENELRHTLRMLADLKFALDESTLVTVTDTKGRITYVNEKFCSISGYSKDELIGKAHNITNSGYHSKNFFQICGKPLAAVAFGVEKYVIRKKQGKHIG